MRFLIYVDGHPPSDQAVRLGGQLARAAGAQVTLLAAGDDAERRRAALARAQALLPAPADEKTRTERGARAILAEAETGAYDLLVAGSRGLRGWRRLAFGSVASRLARYSPVPVLIVKGPPRAEMRRLLACTGGGAPGERVARWAGRIAAWTGATTTVLHVMSQLALSPLAPVDELEETAEQAMADRTREGQHLTRELELAQAQAGEQLPPTRAKLRHGLVVDEVRAEVAEGDYDLVVIGGHQAPGAAAGLDRVRAYLLEDVADQLLLALQRPVLVVKDER